MKKRMLIGVIFPIVFLAIIGCIYLLRTEKNEPQVATLESLEQKVATEKTVLDDSLKQATAGIEGTLEMDAAGENSVTEADINIQPTIKQLLQAALEPVGHTLYVYGGGWNEEDTGAGVEALSLGVSPRWQEFFDAQDGSYDYKLTRYQIHDGLDCTGLVGYAFYQIFQDSYSEIGYVGKSTTLASQYAELFGGEWTARDSVEDYCAGDIMSGGSGHAFIVIGQCEDGSLVLMHASPPAVTLAGTPAKDGNAESQAVKLAGEYMEKCCPECVARYGSGKKAVKASYLTDYDQYRFTAAILSDPEGYRQMTPEEILHDLLD